MRHALTLMEVALTPPSASSGEEADAGKEDDAGSMGRVGKGHAARVHHSVHDAAARKVWKLLFARHGSKEEAKQVSEKQL